MKKDKILIGPAGTGGAELENFYVSQGLNS
jgi:hypothetical protein